MAGKMAPKTMIKNQPKGKSQRLSLYPLDLETALVAAARTGRVSPVKSAQPNRQRKKRAPST